LQRTWDEAVAVQKEGLIMAILDLIAAGICVATVVLLFAGGGILL
jgi:hypothetical protein